MNLDELETLANAAKDEISNPQGRLHFFSTQFYNAANPETILALIALVRELGEMLPFCNTGYQGYEAETKYTKALAKYKEVTSGN
jgi:hypothetical protein